MDFEEKKETLLEKETEDQTKNLNKINKKENYYEEDFSPDLRFNGNISINTKSNFHIKTDQQKNVDILNYASHPKLKLNLEANEYFIQGYFQTHFMRFIANIFGIILYIISEYVKSKSIKDEYEIIAKLKLFAGIFYSIEFYSLYIKYDPSLLDLIRPKYLLDILIGSFLIIYSCHSYSNARRNSGVVIFGNIVDLLLSFKIFKIVNFIKYLLLNDKIDFRVNFLFFFLQINLFS